MLEVKRPIFNEDQIVTTTLHEYPELERRFNEYELAWMSRPLVSYPLNLVREFFSYYLALLEKDCPSGASLFRNMKYLDTVLVREVNINILECTLNRFLFWPEYEIPDAIPDLEH